MLVNITIAYSIFSLGMAIVAYIDTFLYLKRKVHYKCRWLTHFACFTTFAFMSPLIFICYAFYHEEFRYTFVKHIVEKDKEF